MSRFGRYVFVKLFQAHPFVRRYVFRRDKWMCKLCGRRITSIEFFWHVHHWDYAHECVRPKLRPVWAPLNKKGGPRHPDCIATRVRRLELPDCESCFRETPEAFRACVSRVSAAHAGCNKDFG